MIRVVIARLADRGRFAIALLFLLVSTQLLWAADPMPESPPPLARMAEAVLGDHGLAAPPVATSRHRG